MTHRPENPDRPEGPCHPSVSYSPPQHPMTRPRVRPAADLVEREDGFHLYLDMPGVTREDLTIDIEGDELSIVAVTRFGRGCSERVHALEFGDVEYHAKFVLSDMVDVEGIGAQLSNGVLVVDMPRRESARPRRIRVEVG